VATQLIELALDDLGDYFARYRLRSPSAERVLEGSLRRYGQIAPVVVVRWQQRYEIVDGARRQLDLRAGRNS
jgi:ParB-like chromosome segregation protein Spo0J